MVQEDSLSTFKILMLRKYNAVNDGDSASHTSDGFILRSVVEGSDTSVPTFTISATNGESTSATISGTFPNFHIDLVVQKGIDGINGQDAECPECNPCPEGMVWDPVELCCVNEPDPEPPIDCDDGYHYDWDLHICVPNA